MALKVCPRCSSWRVQGSETGSLFDRLLLALNLRLYYCDDCNWQGIGRIKGKRNHAGEARRLLAWKYVFIALIIFAAAYAVSVLLVHMIGGNFTKNADVVSAGPNRGVPETGLAVAKEETTAPKPLSVVKVIGNRDSKLYHLPGMKYYQRVAAYHRVEFPSEEEAIAAGYRKAPR